MQVDGLTGEPVALKVLKEGHLALSASLVRFRREARLLARIRHDSIVKVHSFGRWGRSWYIAMELLGGEDLGRLARRAGLLDPPQAARILVLALEALQIVHAAGAVHRDLKPDNTYC